MPSGTVRRPVTRSVAASSSSGSSTRVVHPLGLAAKGAGWYLVADTEAATVGVEELRALGRRRLLEIRPDECELVRGHGTEVHVLRGDRMPEAALLQECGRVIQERAVDSRFLGEGLTEWRGQLIQLTPMRTRPDLVRSLSLIATVVTYVILVRQLTLWIQ